MNWLLFLIVMLMTISSITSVCPDHCNCNGTDLECYKTLPSFIPQNVSSVTAHEIPVEPSLNFTYTDWHSVTHLLLSLGKVVHKIKDLPYRHLQNGEFTGLMNLQHLKLMCNCRLLVNQTAFHDLSNVSVLDFSHNALNLQLLDDIVAALTGKDVLPHVSELFLSNISDWYKSSSSVPLFLDSLDFAMENKPLQVLDLSGTNISFHILQFNTPPQSLFPQLHILNISRAGPALFSLSNIYQYYKQRPEAVFSNLQVLDASYPYFLQSELECQKTEEYYRPFCPTGEVSPNFLHPNLRELHLKNVFNSHASELRGDYNSSHLCITTKFFSTNKIICVRENFKHLQKLDISNNNFTYIQPKLMQPLQSLVQLDVSNNNLGSALADANFAKSFFDALKNTEVLLFSNNSITSLSDDLLRSNTKLRILDLSQNRLTSVDLGINEQAPLQLLDLSYNNIVSVDSKSCEWLKNVHFSSSTSNASIYGCQKGLSLEGNPLSCTCENLCIFKLLQDHNKTFSCITLHNTMENVDFSFVKHFEYRCKKALVTATFSVDAFLSIIVIGLAITFIWKERRKLKLKRLKESGIEQYRTARQKYVVFLSFAGDDEDFVMTRVYPQLEAELKRILNTDSDCVATGGTHFRPGYAIHDEIRRCVRESSVVIFFLSDIFINKSWCRSEVHKAFCDEKQIVLMIQGKLDLKSMPRVLRKHYETFTRVHWTLHGGQYVMRPNMKDFCATIVGLIGKTDE